MTSTERQAVERLLTERGWIRHERQTAKKVYVEWTHPSLGQLRYSSAAALAEKVEERS